MDQCNCQHDLPGFQIRQSAVVCESMCPSKKILNAENIRCYLGVATISNNGLLFVCQKEASEPVCKCIIILQGVLSGLLIVKHTATQLRHPTDYQVKQIVSHRFLALEMDSTIRTIKNAYHECGSLKPLSHTLVDQSSIEPPECVGANHT